MPLRHRTHSAAIAAASDWIFNYLVVQITPISISNIRWKTYIIFFVLNVAFAIIVWLFYPETSGRSLEEIDALYLGDNNRRIVIDKRGRLLPGFSRRLISNSDGAATEINRTSEYDTESGNSKALEFAIHKEISD
jgi:hypothetical protein